MNLHILARKEEVRGQGGQPGGIFFIACTLCGRWSPGVATRRMGSRGRGGR